MTPVPQFHRFESRFFALPAYAALAACAPAPKAVATPSAPERTIMTVREPGQGISSDQLYAVNLACFAGYKGMAEISGTSGAEKKRVLFMEAAADALERGLAAGKQAGKSADEIHSEFDARATLAAASRKATGADVMLCALFYPIPGEQG